MCQIVYETNMAKTITTIQMIGQRMKARRNYLRLTQEHVAKRVPISRPTYTLWEQGNVQGLSIEDLQNVAAALRVPISYFFPADEDEWAQEGDIGAYFGGLPPEMQPIVLEMIKAAHQAAKAQETTHGRKAE
jgi:transcriptional regulator with XRE-family HTH domain